MELRLATESPIEDLFIGALLPRISDKVTVAANQSVDTRWGRFRPDFVFTVGGRRIAVECDGKDFHNSARDEYRDALILGSDCVDEIYRFRGQDVVYHPEDCLFLLSLHHPRLFSERGGHIVERLTTEPARIQLPHYVDAFDIAIQYEEDGPGLFFRAFRRGHRKDNWLTDFFNFAVQSSAKDLDGVIEDFRARAQAALAFFA